LLAAKPVVSFDVDGAREVVIPGQTGYLVPPQQVEPLAGAILELVRDPPLRQRLGLEGRRRYADVFRHERMTARLRAIYADLLAKK
jgi:glycosyltransferase involved in cell wall biosynthesis